MTAKRILFGVLTPHGGGHTRTAVALADALRSRGYSIDFLVATPGEPVRTALITDAGFRVVPIKSHYARFWRSSFHQDLRRLVRRSSYDVLHWFELHGLRQAALIAAEEKRAFVWTHTSGGVVAPGYYGLNRVVVYTREVATDVSRRSPKTTVHLVPARLDLRSLDRRFVDAARRDVRSAIGVHDTDLLIVRVARCSSVYLQSVRLGIELAVQLTRLGRSAMFLHAGYEEEPETKAQIDRLVGLANAGSVRPVAYSLTEDLQAGTRYMAAADVCIASGRSAIEALALERPTLVVWSSRYLGMVNEANIQQVADTNFQGRDTEKAGSDEEIVSGMLDAVRERLAEPDHGARSQGACGRFIKEHYSVETAADAYEQLYADRVVTVDGFLKHYSHPRHLARELYHRLPPSLRFSRPAIFLRRTNRWPGLQQVD